MALFPSLKPELKQYLIVTGNYWAFTLTDGALRMLVVLYFHQLGYTPISIAMLFVFYELFGVVTNLVGGWLGARMGLNVTMNVGLALQIIALWMLLVPTSMLSVIWVMAAQALSGVAKDLNKMSAKSSIKILIPENAQGSLFRWVALLTGSKNTLKGVGFFLGGFLLSIMGFSKAVLLMSAALLAVFVLSYLLLKRDIGKSPTKPKFSKVFSKSRSINILSAARFFLFGARDVWFVVAVPVYLSQNLAWQYSSVGAFFACWVIAYGGVQAIAPRFFRAEPQSSEAFNNNIVAIWGGVLSAITILITLVVARGYGNEFVLVAGLLLFGAIFAINSSLHSYLIVSFADADRVSMDVGFYYMANALGRLVGTILSGLIFQLYGLEACLVVSSLFLVIASLISHKLPGNKSVPKRASS